MLEMSCAPRRASLAMKLSLGMALAILSGAAMAKGADQTKVVPILKTDINSFGQPIVFPQGSGQVAISIYEIPVGAKLPIHKHITPRVGYVLSGTIQVTNVDTGDARTFHAGEAIVESVASWHTGANVGTKPLKLLVVDLQPKGASDPTILKK